MSDELRNENQNQNSETTKNQVLDRKIIFLSLNYSENYSESDSEDTHIPPTVFRLHKDRVVFGTVESADVRLNGDDVSPIHAVLEYQRSVIPSQEKIVLYDLASDTGVYVNGKSIVTQELKIGDIIQVGKYELTFNLEDEDAFNPRQRIAESEGRKLFFNPNEDLSALLLESEANVVEIFDYTPTQKRALQVVMSWRGTVLDVEHFVTTQSVTVGTTRKSDFGIPPLLSSSRYAIVTRVGEGFVIHLDPQMKGVIQKKGQLKKLDEFKANGSQLPIENDDFAKISIGDVDFYLCYTAAPPRLKMGRIF